MSDTTKFRGDFQSWMALSCALETRRGMDDIEQLIADSSVGKFSDSEWTVEIPEEHVETVRFLIQSEQILGLEELG